ncbi:hypothetical protein [Pontibacillus yanchengensis]|uniref:Lipoprotein n=1 Tax=Pontibacillus yanchengensis Y32 TaxID=1385514 RepID=A0A0A2T8X4_9BACI|nr:hypothetical protein [Pontibacillus yanchengensis]KGP71999.1 hypothetical protein N782_06325 [Pontibacillus yanchengensis Y32]
MKQIGICCLMGLILVGCSFGNAEKNPTITLEQNPEDSLAEPQSLPNDESLQSSPLNKAKAEIIVMDYAKTINLVATNTETGSSDLLHYDTKDELIKHFEHFMTEDFASSTVNEYFQMENGNLHVKKSYQLTNISERLPFTLEKVNNNEYKIFQQRETQSKGIENLYFTLRKDSGVWKVKGYSKELIPYEDNNEELARTILYDYEMAFKDVLLMDDRKLEQTFDTKEGLQEHLRTFVDEQLAQSHTEEHYKVVDGNLSIQEHDAPIFLDRDGSFKHSISEEDELVVVQEQNNPLTPHRMVEFTLTGENGYWQVDSIDVTSLIDEDD